MPSISEICVEVRDKNLNRIGCIIPDFLNLEVRDEVNNVGQWKLTLPAEHHLVETLRTPGSGIIITGPGGVIMTGPTSRPEFVASPSDRQGTITFEGLSDSICLADALAWPQPGNDDPSTQTVAYDERTGFVEDLLHGFVDDNIGPGAPVSRRKANLVMGANLNRGPEVYKAARFDTLGLLLADIAKNTDLGFRVVQRDDELVFETYAYEDRTDVVRLDVNNGTLASSKVAYGPPALTRAIMGGAGEEDARLIDMYSSTESLDAEADWGRRIEKFVDAREINDPDDLLIAATEVLTADGATKVAAQAIPVDGETMVYGVDWVLGDKVKVVIGDQEYTNVVTGLAIKAGSDGFDMGLLFGDDSLINGAGQAADIANRVSALERKDGVTVTGGGGGPDLSDEVAALEDAVDALELTVASHGTDIGILDTRLDAAEADIAALEAVDIAYDARLDALEAGGGGGGGSVAATRVYRTTTQSITTNVPTILTFNAEQYDSNAMHDLVTNTDRITIQTAGVYTFGANVLFDGGTAGNREVKIYLNGSTVLGRIVQTATNSVTGQNINGCYEFAVGDYIQVEVTQNGGTALNVLATHGSPSLWATRIAVAPNITVLENPPTCRVHRTSSFNVSTATQTAIPFPSERYDPTNMHSTSSNTERITIATAGVYHVGGQAEFSAHATGRRMLSIRVNGTTFIATECNFPNSGTLTPEFGVSTYWKFAAGDYVELVAYQESGTTLSILYNANRSPDFFATRVGAG